MSAHAIGKSPNSIAFDVPLLACKRQAAWRTGLRALIFIFPHNLRGPRFPDRHASFSISEKKTSLCLLLFFACRQKLPIITQAMRNVCLHSGKPALGSTIRLFRVAHVHTHALSFSLATLLPGALTECFCGDKVPAGDGKAGNCDNRCTGDKTKVCGGRNRINIYEFTEDSSPSDGKHQLLGDDKVDGAETLGCYEDSTKKRVLEVHSFDDKTKMTAQVRIVAQRRVSTYSTSMLPFGPLLLRGRSVGEVGDRINRSLYFRAVCAIDSSTIE